MAGYKRQSASEILNGLDITAPPLNAEFNRLQQAFDGIEGHNHDGSEGSGGRIPLELGVSGLLNVANGGTGGRHNLSATTSPTATADLTADYAVGSIWVNTQTDRVYICVDDSVGAAIWNELVLLQPGGIFYTEQDATVDIGSSDKRFRELHLANDAFMDGNQDLGGDLLVGGDATVSGSVTATQGFVGDLTGNVTGDVTGDLTGDVTSTGNSTFEHVTINGTVDFTGAILRNLSEPANPTDGATKSYVDASISNLLGGAGDALDTLNELASALGDDPDFATTVSNDLAKKVSKAGDTMTGNLVMDGGATVEGLPAPAAGTHAVSLDYLNSRVGPLEDAQTNAVLAEAWANEAVDTVVQNGKFSARHHAIKASQSASAAGNSADNAALSESNASDSANAASTSETAAGNHAANALAYRDTAEGYRDNAAGFRNQARDAKTAAETAESNARQSEDDAYSYKQDAETSADNALSSKQDAEAALASFHAKYIGSLDVEPNQDLNGNPVSAGQLYLNTSDNYLYVYTGSDWVRAFFDPAAVSITGGAINVPSLKVNGNDVWHSGNDGDGSGLDADKLDGLNSSQFLRSDTADALNAGRGPVYIENHVDDNADGAGITLRTSSNPSDDGGAIFAVRSSGDAVRLWVGQKYTSTGYNPLLVGTDSDGIGEPHIHLPTHGDPTVGGNKFWHAGNHGPDSGLDADLLDGNHADAFLKAKDPVVERGYLEIKPYNSGYDDGSIIQSYYDGTNRTWRINAKDEDNTARPIDISLGGNKVWHKGNHGGGSGLNADMLDGKHHWEFLSSNGGDIVKGQLLFDTDSNRQPVQFGRNQDANVQLLELGVKDTQAVFRYIEDTAGEGTGNFGSYSFVLAGNEGENDLAAFMIHKDGVDVQGNRVWHSGNDGDGSGLDADLIRGKVPSFADDPQTAALRTGSADLFVRMLRATYRDVGNIDASAAVFMRNHPDDDNYQRPVNASGFVDWLNANNSGLNADKLDGLGSGAFIRSNSETNAIAKISTTDNVESGRGSGGVAMTINDGHGNANLTFNHASGFPEQDGNAGRIAVNTDESSNAQFRFKLGSGLTKNENADLDPSLVLSETKAEFNVAEMTVNDHEVWHSGNDGPGSDLNADKLDGLHAGQLMRSDAHSTTSGYITIANGSPQLRLEETDTGAESRLILSNSHLYIQAGEESDPSGEIRFTGMYGNDLSRFTVQTDGESHDIWHEGNDGSGSGLDADMLDGLHKGSFLRADTKNGYVDFGNNEADDFSDVDGRLFFDSSVGMYVAAGNGKNHSNAAALWSSANVQAGNGVKVEYDGEDLPTISLGDLSGNLNVNGESLNNIGRLDFDSGDYAEYETTVGLKIFENGNHTATIGPNSWFKNRVQFDGFVDSLQVNANQTEAGRPAGKFIKARDDGGMSPALIAGGDGEANDLIAEFRGSKSGSDVNGSDSRADDDWQQRFWGNGDVSVTGKILQRTGDEVASVNDGNHPVGSLMMAKNLGGVKEYGDTMGSADLVPASADGGGGGGFGLRGTWRCLGFSLGSAGSNDQKTTLWQRIA